MITQAHKEFMTQIVDNWYHQQNSATSCEDMASEAMRHISQEDIGFLM